MPGNELLLNQHKAREIGIKNKITKFKKIMLLFSIKDGLNRFQIKYVNC